MNKKRGRTKKVVATESVETQELGIVKKRGRPKKVEGLDLPQRKRRVSKKAKISGDGVYWGPEPDYNIDL